VKQNRGDAKFLETLAISPFLVLRREKSLRERDAPLVDGR
jgi:hypothetical protein